MDNKEVIVPMDMNPQKNREVLESAVNYSNEEARIHVVSVALDSAEEEFRTEVLDEAEQMFREIETGDRDFVRIKEGDGQKPSEVISEYAGNIGADLVIMYTSGREGLRRLLLGSTTGDAINKCPCPVLTLSETN